MLSMLGLAVLGGLTVAAFISGGGMLTTGLGRGAGLLAVIMAVLVLAASGRSMRRIASPLNNLSEAASRVAAGEYTARVEDALRGPASLRELVRPFNVMTTRLEVDTEQRRSLLADVSHELRQPLAVIRGELEALQDGAARARTRPTSACCCRRPRS